MAVDLKQLADDASRSAEDATAIAQSRVASAEAAAAEATAEAAAQAEGEPRPRPRPETRPHTPLTAAMASERMSYEGRIAEVSALVGKYESARQQDLATISALREEVAELGAAAAELPDVPAAAAVAVTAAHVDESALWGQLEHTQRLLRMLSGETGAGDGAGLSPPVWPGEEPAAPIAEHTLVARQQAEAYYLAYRSVRLAG